MMPDVDRSHSVDLPGRGIVMVAWSGTVLFCVVAIAAAVSPGAVGSVAVGVDLVLFAVGIGAFLQAYAIAIQRSRHDAIGIGGLYFLAGSAPRSAQWRLLTPLLVQLVVGLATAGARPFTRLAFGVLVPIFGLGLCGVWGARHGTFAPRAPSSRAAPPRKSVSRGRGVEAGRDVRDAPSPATGAPVEQNADHG